MQADYLGVKRTRRRLCKITSTNQTRCCYTSPVPLVAQTLLTWHSNFFFPWWDRRGLCSFFSVYFDVILNLTIHHHRDPRIITSRVTNCLSVKCVKAEISTFVFSINKHAALAVFLAWQKTHNKFYVFGCVVLVVQAQALFGVFSCVSVLSFFSVC